MSKISQEEWYDKEVAPKLMEICKECQERDVPFLSVVEYAEEEKGVTRYLGGDPGFEMIMFSHLVTVGKNIDGFMIGLKKYSVDHDIDVSSSIYLSMEFDGEVIGRRQSEQNQP